MARINLLPWRAERRKQRQREFMTMLGFAAIAGVVLSALIWFYYDRQVSGQGIAMRSSRPRSRGSRSRTRKSTASIARRTACWRARR